MGSPATNCAGARRCGRRQLSVAMAKPDLWRTLRQTEAPKLIVLSAFLERRLPNSQSAARTKRELANSLALICSPNCMCAAPVLHTRCTFFPCSLPSAALQVCVFLLFLHISLPFQSSGLHQTAIVRAEEEKQGETMGAGSLFGALCFRNKVVGLQWCSLNQHVGASRAFCGFYRLPRNRKLLFAFCCLSSSTLSSPLPSFLCSSLLFATSTFFNSSSNAIFISLRRWRGWWLV